METNSSEASNDLLLEHGHQPTSAQGLELLPKSGYKMQQHKSKRRTETEEKREAGVDTGPLPSKEYLAEGSEHIYRTHTCPMCRRCFKMRSHLQEHLHLHFPEPSLQCPTCKRYFTSKSKLRIHRLREAGEIVHRCHLCEYSAVERNAVRRHLVRVHAESAETDANSYPCPTCGQSFHLSRSLKAHMKTHNSLQDSKPLVCFQQGCSFQTSLRKEFLQHTTEVHGITACECRHHACGALFQSEADMEAHYRTHLAYHCSQCDFSSSNKTVFLHHQRHGHTGNERLCCDFCSFVTFNPVEFEQHLGHLHANEKIHRCSQCSYMTSHKRGLKRHMLMHSGEKPHKCSVCDFRCRDESYLSKHMLTHSNDKNFMCAECGYVTKWKHYLNVHMRKHAGDLRYQCDQCPYRSHRMDQLNSHKLRHQAKTLMCEICAYACKRKYELRIHMMAKHSGQKKQESVYNCRYCTYTTCYRQALQNHENCKHTKLKEFRCALCTYSSFSSISLFLHKRKAHGYVPGDKAWLENYAAVEKERNSAELQDFYYKSSTTHKEVEQFSEEEPAKPPGERPELPESANHIASIKSVTASQTFDAESVFAVVSQEVVSEGVSDSPPTMNGPEEYCTLVLTTLSTTDCQTPTLQNEEDTGACKTLNSPTLNCNSSDMSQEMAFFSPSSTEEENIPMADTELGQCDLDEPLNYNDHPEEAAEFQTQTPGGDEDVGTVGSSSPLEKNQLLQSKLCLEAIRKHDKEQAEAMVLEGRVQMLVVPTKDVYSCDKCSYATNKETSFKYHCKTVCCGRNEGHRCQACGAQFKQKRGLDSHKAKKCPAIQRKTRTFVSIPVPCLSTGDNLAVSQEEVEEEANTNELELRTLQNRTGTHSSDTELDRQRTRVHTSHLTNCEDLVANASSGADHPVNITQTDELLKVQPADQQLLSSNKQGHVPLQSLYTQKSGKFICKLCNFVSVRTATVERHLSNCKKRQDLSISEVNNPCSIKHVKTKEDLVLKLGKRTRKVSKEQELFSCPSCHFKCYQKRALACHKRKGCLKPGEVQCTMCSFVAKCKTSLARHIFYIHNKKKLGVNKPKHLQCQHCSFTCKQERHMDQHVALKHKGARPHCCQYCPFSTTRRHRLEEHESLHTGIGRRSCDLCEKTFGTVTKLRQHKIRIHHKQPSHFCPLCDFSGYTLDDVRRHNLRCHSGELRHACTFCQAKFSSEVALRNHCKRAHVLQTCFPCKQCDYTCGSEAMLKTHQETKHHQAKCTTNQENTKKSPAKNQKGQLSHQCQLCPVATKTRQLLAQHLLSEHEEGSPEDKPLKCSTCQFACRHQLVLEQHLRLHGGKRVYKCTDCDYSTQNKQKITWHIRIHTGEKPYSCEQCSYTCTDPSRLKLHMRVHLEEKKYLCPKCGYKCKWATQLKYHMTKHTGDKPYACDQCDYRTNRADALRSHKDTQHCDTRPYVCEKCGKAFKTTFILKTHQRQHSSDRPYRCGLCNKAFRWPAGLRNHFMTHTKQQPFRCRHCPYKAKQKFQVVKHLQRHHPELPVEQGVVRDSETGGLTLKDALQGTLDERAIEVEDEEGAENANERS